MIRIIENSSFVMIEYAQALLFYLGKVTILPARGLQSTVTFLDNVAKFSYFCLYVILACTSRRFISWPSVRIYKGEQLRKLGTILLS
ncbi:hypothetical protein NIE88_14280 [Sporolactobacillus shoreicorticis]|uniref:Uncharacterized protein n=1 Tax=Sporolactobacillus shoreicorticis TaxID=1923877 RepID=A0ABW5S9B5_9BACL|nr:hypothetical protein [Sporolactobacillus shoreicorticis]MCO7126935.1 hypothetical protein [Sporolactobacillus shoreicorticis]